MSASSISMNLLASVLAAGLAASIATAAHAAGNHSSGHHSSGHHGSAIGEPGKSADATRTITVVLQDNSFEPEKISVAKGETVRFAIVNKGEFVHEFNIGTAAMHAEHRKEMMTMVEHGVLEVDRIHHDKMKMDMGGGKTMEHDDPNSALLEPGKSAEIVWTFNANADLEFACNVPGHYEAGMVGTFEMKHGG